ncbi:Cytochrome c oxidase copper chaperone [Recurvomyces mirabilis]|nr:Cytochrome c oxidase copper chaperone [Recurvomyces mirabilis]
MAMQPNNLASDLKSQGAEATQKPKPCCVCKDEKSARDECMLFSTAADPQDACKDLVGQYKTCMKGYGFSLP